MNGEREGVTTEEELLILDLPDMNGELSSDGDFSVEGLGHDAATVFGLCPS